MAAGIGGGAVKVVRTTREAELTPTAVPDVAETPEVADQGEVPSQGDLDTPPSLQNPVVTGTTSMVRMLGTVSNLPPVPGRTKSPQEVEVPASLV